MNAIEDHDTNSTILRTNRPIYAAPPSMKNKILNITFRKFREDIQNLGKT